MAFGKLYGRRVRLRLSPVFVSIVAFTLLPPEIPEQKLIPSIGQHSHHLHPRCC